MLEVGLISHFSFVFSRGPSLRMLPLTLMVGLPPSVKLPETLSGPLSGVYRLLDQKANQANQESYYYRIIQRK